MKPTATPWLLCFVIVAGALAAQAEVSQEDAAAARAASESVPAEVRAWLADHTEPRAIPSWLLSRQVIEAIEPAQLHELLEGADPASMQTRSGEPLGTLVAKVGLGSTFGKSVFTPIAPCRVIDTRVAAGKLAAGETRRYVLRGETTDYSAYGGTAAGCGIPDGSPCVPSILSFKVNQASALVLAVTAVEPEGLGQLRLWAANRPEPAGSRLSYTGPPHGFDLANEVIAAMCDEVAIAHCNLCPMGDVAVSATGAASHVVVDVVGYFSAFERFEVQAYPTSAVTTADLALSGECKSYGELRLCFSSKTKGTVVVEADLDCQIEHVYGTNDVVSFTLSDAASGCVAPNADWRWPSTLPSGIYDTQLHLTREFPLNPGQGFCINPRGQMLHGATAGDRCLEGQARGIFYPDGL